MSGSPFSGLSYNGINEKTMGPGQELPNHAFTSASIDYQVAKDFAEQIAHTSIVALQYNILSLVKRFNDYETIGGLFREVEKGSLELTIAERIWEVIMETVITIANLFGLTDEEVLEVAVRRSDELAHICRTFKLKAA